MRMESWLRLSFVRSIDKARSIVRKRSRAWRANNPVRNPRVLVDKLKKFPPPKKITKRNRRPTQIGRQSNIFNLIELSMVCLISIFEIYTKHDFLIEYIRLAREVLLKVL